MKKIEIYTDASVGNNNVGYAYYIEEESSKVIGYDFINDAYLNSNEAELLAIIEAIKKIEQKSKITIYTDSLNLMRTLREGKVVKSIKPVFWSIFIKLSLQHSINFKWIKGHRNNKKHNLCDTYAKKARIQKVSGFRKHYIKKDYEYNRKIKITLYEDKILLKRPNDKIRYIAIPKTIKQSSYSANKEKEMIFFILNYLKKKNFLHFNLRYRDNFDMFRRVEKGNLTEDKDYHLSSLLSHKIFTYNLMKIT